MKNRHLKDIELLKKIFETLPKKKTKKIEKHLNKCEECQKRYQFLTNKFKPFLETEEKHFTAEEINGLFKSFIKEKGELYKSPAIIKRKIWALKLAIEFIMALLLIALSIKLFFFPVSLKKSIRIKSFQNQKIIINKKLKNLSKIQYLPANKTITAQGDLTINIKKDVIITMISNTKFIISKEEQYIFNLLDGEAHFKTLKEKKIYVKVNHFLIKPIGTIFKVSYINKILKVLLLEGTLEVLNLSNKEKTLLTPSQNVVIYGFKHKNQAKTKPILSEKQLEFYDTGLRYQKSKEWVQAIYWYKKFIQNIPEERLEKYNAMFDIGMIYYNNLKNMEEAKKYFNIILKSKFSSQFADKIALEFK